VDVVAQIRNFLEPKSVAIFGTSRAPARAGSTVYDVLTNLISLGYRGKIYPIHPNASEVHGLRAYATVAAVPGNIDLAVINLPRDLIPGVVKECVKQGINAITILTQGFADAGDADGKRLQKEMDDAIRGTETRILGPNTLGTANPYIKFSSAFAETQMDEIPVGFMCQTGAFFVSLAGLKLMGKAIDLGNGSDVHFSDGLEFFEQDADTRVIGMHIEGIKDAARFLKVVHRVARKKPVIALKTGRSVRAARAAQSHTGSLVGKEEIWNAALKQAGVIRVADIEEFGDTIRAFYMLPPMKGRRLGIVSGTGGFGVMGIDACQEFGLEVAEFSSATTAQLRALYPSWQEIDNPADMASAFFVVKKELFEIFGIQVEALLNDPGIDGVLCITGVLDISEGIAYSKVAEKATTSHPDKPLVFYFYGSSLAAEGKRALESKAKSMVFPSPDRAIRALGHLADYSDFRRSCDRLPL